MVGKLVPSADVEAAAIVLDVAVVSDVRLVRERLTLSLRDRKRIGAISAFSMAHDQRTALARLGADVVLVDLGTMSLAAAARRVRPYCLGSRLVAFALAEQGDSVFACAALGFRGYVPCDGGPDEVYRAVLDAVDGRMHCSPAIAAAMFGRLGDLLQPSYGRSGAAGLSPLTGREREILEWVERGCSNKEIAQRLSISSATVKNHMHSILQKLQVGRRGQAAAVNRRAKGTPHRRPKGTPLPWTHLR